MNKVIIIGNLGRDPEMRFGAESGEAFTTFSVAVNEQKKVKGVKVKITIWFNVTTFGKTAENCNQYLHAGSKVMVEGKLGCQILDDGKTGVPRMYERKDGSTMSVFDIEASNVEFLSPNSSESNDDEEKPRNQRQQTQRQAPASVPDDDENIPF